MKPKIPLYILLAVLVTGLILFLMSLDKKEEEGSSSYRTEATGGDGELVLVNPDEPEDRIVADTVASVLGRDMPGLPRPEPYFDIIRVEEGKLGDDLKGHQRIIFVEVSEEKDHAARLAFGADQWAKGQLIFRLTGNDRDSLIRHFLDRSDRMMKRMQKKVREEHREAFEGEFSASIDEELRKEHGLSLKVPQGFEIKKSAERFVWLERYRQLTKDGRQRSLMEGIFIYYRPYEKEEQFDRERLLQVRDSVLKKHVPGPSDGSYMSTEDRYPDVAPVLEEVELDGKYAAKLRGLWRVENDQMGGPFISLSTYHEATQRLITAEGFIYGPGFQKRDHIRNLEAMIYTLEALEEKSS